MIGDLFRELPTISFKIFNVYLHRLDNLRAASALHLRYQTSTEISSIHLYLESYLRVCISTLSNLFFVFWNFIGIHQSLDSSIFGNGISKISIVLFDPSYLQHYPPSYQPIIDRGFYTLSI